MSRANPTAREAPPPPMLPPGVRAGRIAHKGMAPAMAGQADQRGYERVTQ